MKITLWSVSAFEHGVGSASLSEGFWLFWCCVLFTVVGGVLGCLLATTISPDSFFSILTGVVSPWTIWGRAVIPSCKNGPSTWCSRIEWRGRGLLFKWGLGVLAQSGVEATTHLGVVMFTFSLLGGELGALLLTTTRVLWQKKQSGIYRVTPYWQLQRCSDKRNRVGSTGWHTSNVVHHAGLSICMWGCVHVPSV